MYVCIVQIYWSKLKFSNGGMGILWDSLELLQLLVVVFCDYLCRVRYLKFLVLVLSLTQSTCPTSWQLFHNSSSFTIPRLSRLFSHFFFQDRRNGIQ